ncbi:unnamed protein product, partial [Staurois parvus]
MTPKGRGMMGLVVCQQLEGRWSDPLFSKLQVHEALQKLTVTSMTLKGRGMMGLVVCSSWRAASLTPWSRV